MKKELSTRRYSDTNQRDWSEEIEDLYKKIQQMGTEEIHTFIKILKKRICAVHHVGVMGDGIQQMQSSQMTYEAEFNQLQWEEEQCGEKNTIMQLQGLKQLNRIY